MKQFYTAILSAPFRNRTTTIRVDVVNGLLKVPARRMRNAENRLGLGANEPLHSDTSFMVVNSDGHMIQAIDAKE